MLWNGFRADGFAGVHVSDHANFYSVAIVLFLETGLIKYLLVLPIVACDYH